MAHYSAIQERRSTIIVLLLSDTLPNDMDADLRQYVTTTTYLKHDDPWFWDKLRYALPDKRNEADEGRQHVQLEHQNHNGGVNYIGDFRNNPH